MSRSGDDCIPICPTIRTSPVSTAQATPAPPFPPLPVNLLPLAPTASERSLGPLFTMTSQLVSIHTPGLKWFLNHLENDFESKASLQLYIKYKAICLCQYRVLTFAVRSNAAPSETLHLAPSELQTSSSD